MTQCGHYFWALESFSIAGEWFLSALTATPPTSVNNRSSLMKGRGEQEDQQEEPGNEGEPPEPMQREALGLPSNQAVPSSEAHWSHWELGIFTGLAFH